MPEENQKPLSNQEKLLKKLDILITRKKMRDGQWERKKKAFAIMIKVMKEHSILSPKDLEEIARLEIF